MKPATWSTRSQRLRSKAATKGEASRDCLTSHKPEDVRSLYFASTTGGVMSNGDPPGYGHGRGQLFAYTVST